MIVVVRNSQNTQTLNCVCCFSVKPNVYIYKINDGFLVCNATGFPPPRLAWYKDKELSLRNKNDETSLKIKHTAGNLTCVATNSVGTSSKSSPFYIAGET